MQDAEEGLQQVRDRKNRDKSAKHRATAESNKVSGLGLGLGFTLNRKLITDHPQLQQL